MTKFDINKSCYLCLNEYKNLIIVQAKNWKNDSIADKLKYVLPELMYFGQDIQVFLCSKCLIDVTLFYIFKSKCLKSNDDLSRHLKKKGTCQNGPPQNHINENQSKKMRDEQTNEEYNKDRTDGSLKQMWNTPPNYQMLINNVRNKIEVSRPNKLYTPNCVNNTNQYSTQELISYQQKHASHNISIQKDLSENLTLVNHVPLQNTISQNLSAPYNTNSQNSLRHNTSSVQKRSSQTVPSQISPNIQERLPQNMPPQNANSQNEPPQNLLRNISHQNSSPSQNETPKNILTQRVVPQNVASHNLSQENRSAQKTQLQNKSSQNVPPHIIQSQNLCDNLKHSQNGRVHNIPSQNSLSQKAAFQNINEHSQTLTNHNLYAQNLTPQNGQAQNRSHQSIPSENDHSKNADYSQNRHSQNPHCQNVPEVPQTLYYSKWREVYKNSLTKLAQNIPNRRTQTQNVNSLNVPITNGHLQSYYNSNQNLSQPNSAHQNINYNWQRQNMQYQNSSCQNAPPQNGVSQNTSHWNPQNMPMSQSITSFNNVPAQNSEHSYWSQTLPPQNGQIQITRSQNIPQTVESVSPNQKITENYPKQNNQTQYSLSQNIQQRYDISNSVPNNLGNILNPNEPIVIDDDDDDDDDIPSKDEFISLDFIDNEDLNYSETDKKLKLEPPELLFDNLNSNEKYEQPDIKLAKLEIRDYNLNPKENKINSKVDDKMNQNTLNLVEIQNLLDNVSENKNEIDPSKIKADENKIKQNMLKPDNINKIPNPSIDSCATNIENSLDIVNEDIDIKNEKDKKLYNELLNSISDQNLVKHEENISKEHEIKRIESELNKLFDFGLKKFDVDTKIILKQEDTMLKSCVQDSLSSKLLLSQNIITLESKSRDLSQNMNPENSLYQNDHSQTSENMPFQKVSSQNDSPKNTHLQNDSSENDASQNIHLQNDPAQTCPVQNVTSQNAYFQNVRSQNAPPHCTISQNSHSANTEFSNIPSQNDFFQNASIHKVPSQNIFSESNISQKRWSPQSLTTHQKYEMICRNEMESEDVANKINSKSFENILTSEIDGQNENVNITVKNDLYIEENTLISKENDIKLYDELKKEDSPTPNNKMEVDEANNSFDLNTHRMDTEEYKIIPNENHLKLYELLKKEEPKTLNNQVEEEKDNNSIASVNNDKNIKSSIMTSNEKDSYLYEEVNREELNNDNSEEMSNSCEELNKDEEMDINIEEHNFKFQDLYEKIEASKEFIDLTEGDDKDIIKCRYCDKHLSKRMMYFHLHIHDGYLCRICKTIFRTKDQLKMHVKKNHKHIIQINYKYKCKVCGKMYKSESYLKIHEMSHFSGLPYKCDLCKKRFGFESVLKQHLKLHDEGEKKFTCNVCGKRFVLRCHILAHMKKHTCIKKTVWKCEICGKNFRRTGNLWQHMLTHKGEKKHECATCGKKFLMKTHLKQHLPIHLDVKDYECYICQKSFRDNASLKRHIETHTKKKNKKSKRKEKMEKQKKVIEKKDKTSQNETQNITSEKEDETEAEENDEPSSIET